MDKLLIVGCGATGTLTASMLAETTLHDLVTMTIWDKGSGVGGRMNTRRNVNDHQIDMGAQYLTRSPNDSQIKNKIFKELIDNNIIVPFVGPIKGEQRTIDNAGCYSNFVCPNGINDVPRYFLHKSKSDVQFCRQLKSVNINVNTKLIECGWSQNDNEGKEEFKYLILTLPVPQLLGLEGNLVTLIKKSHLDDLKRVQYSSRYALGLGYDDDFAVATPWTAQYFEHPIIRYICWDNSKRNNTNNKPSLLVHTTVPFGLEHLEHDKEKVTSIITRSLSELMPSLPTPCYSYLIRWRYSQVYKSYHGTPGCIILHNNPLILATGDAFTYSNIEGCITAAQSATQCILNNFN